MNDNGQVSRNYSIKQLNEVNSASRAARKIPERQLRLQICKEMLYRKWWGGKINTQGTYLKRFKRYIKDRYLLRGVPDLLFFRGDRVVAIEVKAGKNVQTEQQKEFQQHFHNSELKRFYVLAYSWSDVGKVLEIIEK